MTKFGVKKDNFEEFHCILAFLLYFFCKPSIFVSFSEPVKEAEGETNDRVKSWEPLTPYKPQLTLRLIFMRLKFSTFASNFLLDDEEERFQLFKDSQNKKAPNTNANPKKKFVKYCRML